MPNHNQFTFIHWNARSIKPKTEELLNLIHNKLIHVIIITETWLKIENKFKLHPYKITRIDRTKVGGGIMVLIHPSLIINSITKIENYNQNLQAIKIELKNLTLIGIYNTSTNHITRTYWEHNFNIKGHTIISGDLNLGLQPYQIRNHLHNNQFLKYLHEHNYRLVNTDEPTRLGAPHQQDTSPDLTFITDSLANHTTWQVFPDTMRSDHFPVIVKITHNTWRPAEKTSKVQPKIQDWNNFQTDIYNYYQTNHIHHTSDKLIDDIQDTIQDFLDQKYPTKKITAGKIRKKPPWWTPECSQAIALRRRLLNTLRKNMTRQQYIDMKLQTARTTKILKEHRRKGWQEFCNEVSYNTPIINMWKKSKMVHQ